MRLIDADTLKSFLCRCCNLLQENGACEPSECSVLAVVDEQPTVDAAPVVHGWWKRRGRNLGDCSECGEVVMVRYPYCPNCGAKMDGNKNA